MKSFLQSTLFAITGLVGAASISHAATILNANFELDDSPTSPYSYSTVPTDWTHTGSFGTVRPEVYNTSATKADGTTAKTAYQYSYDPTVVYNTKFTSVHGDVLAAAQGAGATLFQTLSITADATNAYALGTYTFSVLAGDSYENTSASSGAAFELQLLSGTTILNTYNYTSSSTPGVAKSPTTAVPVSVSINTATLTPAQLTSVLGTAITVKIISNTGGTDTFDNAAITFTPAPEPTSMAALGIGAIGLLRRRRRSV